MISNPFSKTVAEAMRAQHVNMVMAAEFDFPSGVSRVHSGVGEILINGNVFFGLGRVGKIGEVKEENTTSSTQIALTMSGLESGMVAISLNETCVNRKVTVYVAVMDDQLKSVSYNVIFKGKIVGTSLNHGEDNSINYTLSNVFEEWAKGKPYRNTDDSHRRRNQDDRILRYVAQMSERSLFWGSKKDAPGFRYA